MISFITGIRSTSMVAYLDPSIIRRSHHHLVIQTSHLLASWELIAETCRPAAVFPTHKLNISLVSHHCPGCHGSPFIPNYLVVTGLLQLVAVLTDDSSRSPRHVPQGLSGGQVAVADAGQSQGKVPAVLLRVAADHWFAGGPVRGHVTEPPAVPTDYLGRAHQVVPLVAGKPGEVAVGRW